MRNITRYCDADGDMPCFQLVTRHSTFFFYFNFSVLPIFSLLSLSFTNIPSTAYLLILKHQHEALAPIKCAHLHPEEKDIDVLGM